MYELQIKVELLENKSASWLVRAGQKKVFDSVVNFLSEGFKIDRKQLTKEQKADPVQVFGVEGTKEECEKELQKIFNIEKQQIQNMLLKFANIRVLPPSIRHKLQSYKIDTTNGSWQYLQKALFLFSILITANVVESQQ